MRISVIGGGTIPVEDEALAHELGVEIGERDHTVVCGGLGGTMAAVCRGAAEAGGRTIGILPSSDRGDANPHVDVPIATGLGHARNALVPLNGDVVIALPGGPGTRTEIGFAQIYGRPVVGVGAHEELGVEPAERPSVAVDTADRLGPSA